VQRDAAVGLIEVVAEGKDLMVLAQIARIRGSGPDEVERTELAAVKTRARGRDLCPRCEARITAAIS